MNGKKLREARERRNLTERQLARRAGICTASVRAYEAGERQPRDEAVLLLARALGLTLEETVDTFLEA